MVPTDSRNLIKRVAKETGFSEEMCRDIIYKYWSNVRLGMINGKEPRILVSGLGYFKVSVRKVEAKLNKYYKILENIDSLKNKLFALQYYPWRISVMRNLQEKIFIHREKKRRNGKIRRKIIANFSEES